MTAMEPRVAERRRSVSEERARRRLRWILITIALTAVGAFGFWLIRSPLLSVSTVDISGAERSNPAWVLSELGVGVGTPTIDVNGGAIEQAIEADAWVASADVSVTWPGRITITITEHDPVAPVRAGSGWILISLASTVLEPTAAPTGDSAVIDIDLGPVVAGDVIDDPMVRASIRFVTELRPDLAPGAVLYTEGEGLYATVAGHTVRLGRPVDLATKATVLAVLIDDGLLDGATIDLIAPLRPAVTNPQPVVEVEE